MPATIAGPLHTETMGLPGAPPMVFVHPHPMDSACWVFQMAHLSTWYRTVAVDLPGYGRSPTATAGVTLPEIATACWEALDRDTDQPAILVGCSVGSSVVQHMYHVAPGRTRALVLCGTGYNPTKSFVPRRIAAYREHGIGYRGQHAPEDFSPAFRQTPLAKWFVDLFSERNDSADVDGIIAIFEAMRAPDPDWLQQDLRAPVLILSGSEDNSHANVFALHERLPDAELVTLDGAGHACQIEQPWVFDAHMIRFLARRRLFPGALPESSPQPVRDGGDMNGVTS